MTADMWIGAGIAGAALCCIALAALCVVAVILLRSGR